MRHFKHRLATALLNADHKHRTVLGMNYGTALALAQHVFDIPPIRALTMTADERGCYNRLTTAIRPGTSHDPGIEAMMYTPTHISPEVQSGETVLILRYDAGTHTCKVQRNDGSTKFVPNEWLVPITK